MDKHIRHHAKRILPALAAALAAGCGPSEAKPVAPGKCTVSATYDGDISQPGPFNIGYRNFPVTYQPPGVDAPRTFNLNIWYPTNDTSGNGVYYLNDPLFWDDLSWQNAKLAAPLSSCGYPVIEYSHGWQGLGGGASYMMRHFASHGWVAIAPDHTLDTFTDQVSPMVTYMYYVRSLDMTAGLDAVANLKAPDPLAGKLATDKVMLVGHSFGTQTVWEGAGATYDVPLITSECVPGNGTIPSGSCTAGELAEFGHGVGDPRIVAGIPMAGSLDRAFWGPTGEQSVHIPLLQMSGGDNDVGAGPNWPTLNGINIAWIVLAGGCHETFNLGGCATLPDAVGYEIVRTYAMAFAREYVLGDTEPNITGIVDGTIQVSPLVTYTSK